jgi:signal peptidase II
MVWIVVATVIAIDQVTKYLSKVYIKPAGSIPIIDGIFHLTFVENRGVAFGLLQNKGWFFVPITVVVALVLVFLLLKTGGKITGVGLPLALILGGALGNMYDRIFIGYVVDFLDFRVWPVFNAADSSVVIGAGLLIFQLLFKGESIEAW